MKAVAAYDKARHELDAAEAARGELARLTDVQERRQRWLEEHPDEVRW